MKNKKTAVLLLVLSGLSVLTGCKAEPIETTSFVDGRFMANDPNTPFHKAWKKPGFDKFQYKRLYVAPVNTAYMLQNTEWAGTAQMGDFKNDVDALAVYTQEAVKKAFRQDPKTQYQVLNSPSNAPGTLVLEMAITEVVPSKVVLNALGYAPFGIGLAIKGVRAMAKDRSTAAFEARVRDASTGEVLAMIADREAEQTSVVSVRGLTWFSHVYAMIDQWAKQLVEVANRKPTDAPVKDSSTFTLKPW